MLKVKERPDIGVYVKDLSSYVVNNADDMDRTMTTGNKNSMFCQEPFILFYYLHHSFPFNLDNISTVWFLLAIEKMEDILCDPAMIQSLFTVFF